MGGSLPCRLIVESAGSSPRECWGTLPDLIALVAALPDEQKDAVLDALNACPKYQRDVFEEKLNEYIDKTKEAEADLVAVRAELEALKARKFPVLMTGEAAELRALGCPRVVPWDFVADNAAQCLHNHGQSPERLAERGGLAQCEMVAVVEGRKWRRMTNEESTRRLLELLAAYEKVSVRSPEEKRDG
jgi:hypothetical protein